MKIIQLHQNFILIHSFLYPEPLKKWVQDDLTYTGNYHDNWEELMILVKKIGDDYNWSIFETLKFLEETYYPEEGLSGIDSFYSACVFEIEKREKQS